jgi:hypothetical protein
MWLAIQLYASKLWVFLLPIIKIFMSQIGPVLAEAALAAVMTVATSDMSNEEKRNAAFSAILETLSKKGLQVGASAINLAIEMAVQKLKESSA